MADKPLSPTEMLDTARALSKQFGIFNKVEDLCTSLLSLAGHEAELRKSVAALKAEVAAIGDLSGKKAALEKAVDVLRAEKDSIEREKKDHGRQLDEAKAAIAKAKDDAAKAQAVALDNANATLASVTAAVEARKSQLTDIEAAHEKAVQRLTVSRDEILAQTHELKTHLDALKARVTPLLAT